MPSFPWDIYLEVELLDRIVILFWIFWRIFIPFPTQGVEPIYIATYSAQVPPSFFFYFPTNTCYLLPLYNTHSHRCEVMPRCGFDLRSRMISDAEHLLIYRLVICVSSLDKLIYLMKYVFKYFACFIVGLFHLSWYWVISVLMQSLWHFWTNIYIVNVFFRPVSCFFHFIALSSEELKLYILTKSN